VATPLEEDPAWVSPGCNRLAAIALTGRHGERFSRVGGGLPMAGDKATPRPASLGAIVRLLSAAAQPVRTNDTALAANMRRYLTSSPANIRGDMLLERKLIASLHRLTHARNDAAHLHDPTDEDTATAFGLMIGGEQAGTLLTALGVEGG
jgi:hypothetical protein